MPSQTINSTCSVSSLCFDRTTDPSTAQTTFSVEADTDCWSLHVLLTKEQLLVFREAPNAITLKVARVDDAAISVTSAGPYWIPSYLNAETGYQVRLKLSGNELSQGYVACRYPNVASEKESVIGAWKAELITSYGFGLLNIDEINVWLSQRRLPLPRPVRAGAIDSFTLPVQVVLVAARDQLAGYKVLVEDAVKYARESVFRDAGIALIAQAVQTEVTGETYSSDYYSAGLSALVTKYASDTKVTVLVMKNITIADTGAVGFSMLPGPQGFRCSHAVVVARLDPSSLVSESGPRLGKRIAHEIGHYLGLTHEGSCLGAPTTASDNAACDTALKAPRGADADAIRHNLMFTSTPGSWLNRPQRYQATQVPIVGHRVTIPQTFVTKLRVYVHTGMGIRNFTDLMNGDAAGTDDKVWFELTSAAGTLVRVAVESGADDFEFGSSKWFQLDPGLTLFEEEISGFTIEIGYGLNLGSSDHWLLQGLKIEINGQIWYDNDSIHTWLATDETEPSYYSAVLAGPVSTGAAQATALVRNTPTPSYVVPPFARYPVALQFAAFQPSGANIPSWSVLGATPPTIALQAWIWIEDLFPDQTLVFAGDAQANVFLRVKGGCYEIGVTAGGVEVKASAAVPEGDVRRWIHLCGSYDGTSWMIHRNGDSMATAASAQGLPSELTGPLMFGQNAGSGGCFQGRMRNVSIWKTPRSAAQELRDLFRVDIDDPALLAYWPMDDGDGGSCHDAASGGHNAMVSHPRWYVPQLVIPNALFFPISRMDTGFVTVPGTAKLSSGFVAGITLAAWVCIRSSVSETTGVRVVAATSTFVLQIDGPNYACGAPGSPLCSAAIPLGDVGQWVHLAGQFDGLTGTWRLYRNGAVLAESTVSRFARPGEKDVWSIGGGPTSSECSVAIELRMVWLFGTALSPERLRTVYLPLLSATIPSHSPPDALIACWPLNEGAGNCIYDAAAADPSDPSAANGTIDDTKIRWSVAPLFPRFAFVDAGGSLSSVVSEINDATAASPVTVFIGPGTYVDRVSLRPWVSLIGAGELATTITSIAWDSVPLGTLAAGGHQVIRQLTVKSAGADYFGMTATAISLDGAPGVVMDHVTAMTTDTHEGIFRSNNVKCLCLNGQSGGPPSSLIMTNCTIRSDADNVNITVMSFGSTIDAYATTVTGGVFATILADGGALLRFIDCTLAASDEKLYVMQAFAASKIIARECRIFGAFEGDVTIVGGAIAVS